MQLSDGSATSMTAPPKLPSVGVSSEERAKNRFGVTGNAIITGGAGGIGSVACRALLEHGLQGLDISPQEWEKMFEVNTSEAWLASQAAAKPMEKRGRSGSIILMASISGHWVNFPQPQIHYNASKAAIVSMKSFIAAEWARYGIKVNSISPGYLDTILNEGPGLEGLRQNLENRLPFGRMGQPEELTGTIILLVSKAGNYITGADFLVDGGITIFWCSTNSQMN